MNNRVFTAAASFPLVVALLASAVLAQAPAKSIELSGQIVAVDRVARTLTVVENVTGRMFVVKVPANSLVGIEPSGSLPSAIPFSHVVRGLRFRAVVKRDAGTGASK